MSQHHRRQKWSTDSPKFRKILEPRLPLPCINRPCMHGGIVYPGQPWQVGHLPGHEAAHGRRATINDVGPAHTDCNLRDNKPSVRRVKPSGKRQAGKDIRPWL